MTVVYLERVGQIDELFAEHDSLGPTEGRGGVSGGNDGRMLGGDDLSAHESLVLTHHVVTPGLLQLLLVQVQSVGAAHLDHLHELAVGQPESHVHDELELGTLFPVCILLLLLEFFVEQRLQLLVLQENVTEFGVVDLFLVFVAQEVGDGAWPGRETGEGRLGLCLGLAETHSVQSV